MRSLKPLYNPFEDQSENRLLLLGVATLLIGSLLAFLFNARYDGVIDLHFGDPTSLLIPFLDNLINTFCLFMILFAIGYIINRKTRAIDILVVSLVARAPYYILPLINIKNLSQNTTEKLLPLAQDPTSNIPLGALVLVLIFGAIGILVITWFCALVFNGFRTATHAKGWNLTVGVILAVILAEACSKAVFYYVL